MNSVNPLVRGELLALLSDTRLARVFALAALELTVGKSGVRAAIEGERTLLHGRALGLSDDATREVVRLWSAYHRVTPDPLDWDRVRGALTARAAGEDWRPRGAWCLSLDGRGERWRTLDSP